MSDWIPPADDECVLRTERLTLRPPRPDDAPLVFPLACDPLLVPFMTWEAHRDPGETAAYLKMCVEMRRTARGWNWVILEKGQLRGAIGVESIVRTNGAVRLDRGELGYWVGRPHHGRGIATEAARAALAFAFSRLALHKVFAVAVTENQPSLRVLRKLGFAEIGVRRREIRRDGVWRDLALFEMLEDDPAALALKAPGARER